MTLSCQDNLFSLAIITQRSDVMMGFEWIIFETKLFSMNLTFDFSHFGLGFSFHKGDLSNYFNVDFLFFNLFVWHHPEWEVTNNNGSC